MSLEKAIKNKGGQIYVGTGTGKSSTTGQSSGGGGRVTAAGVDAVSSAAKAFTPKEKNKIQRDILTDDIEELKKKRNALVGSGANIGAGTTGLGISRSSNSNRSQITAIDRIIARKTEQANQLKAEAQRAKREARNAKIVNFARDPLSAVDRAISGVDKVTGKINSGIADVFRGEDTFKARAEANRAMPTASKPSLGRAIEGTIVKGADQAVGFAAQTLDVTLGNALAELGWEDNIIRKAVAKQKANAEANEIYYGKNMANASKTAKKIEQYTTSAMASVPDAIIAMMLAAASPATAGAGALGLTGAGERLLGKEAITAGREAAALATKTSKLATGANTVRTVVGNMARNPLYWTSFAKVVGPSYYQAKEDGASDWAANMYALTNGLFNAAIEVGGGIQTLPFEMRKGPQTFWQFIKNSAGDEGDEEVVQGVIERGLQNLIYGKDNPIWSTTDENAVLNPKTALDEAAGGAWGGLLMGGGQNVTSQLQSSMSNRAIGEAMTVSQKIDTLNPALNMPDYARSRGLADKIVEQIQKGETVSDAKFGELYRAMREDASRNIQPKSEDDSGYQIRQTEPGKYELTSRMGRMAEQIAAKGESAPNAIKAARTISDLLNGGNVAKKQIKNIAKSEAARAVFAETTGAELPDIKTVSVPKMADIIQAEADLYYAKKQADEALAQEDEAIAQARETFDAAVAENAQAAQAEAQEIMGNAVAQAEAETPQAAPEQEQPAAQQPQRQPRETYEEFAARERDEAMRTFGWEMSDEQVNDVWRKATEEDGVRLDNDQTIGRKEFYEVLRKYTEDRKGFTPTDDQLESSYQEYRLNSDTNPMSTDLWNRMREGAGLTEEQAPVAEAPVEEAAPAKVEKPKKPRKPRTRKPKAPKAQAPVQQTTEATPAQAPAPVATGAQAQESVNDDYWESLLNETPPPPKDRRYAITVEEADVAKEQGIDADTDVSREQLLMAMYLQPYLKNVGIENIRFVNDQETKGGRGVWDRDSKTVLINKDRADSAHLVAQTIGHEIFHPAVEQTREESGKLEESLSEDFLGALKDLSNRGLLNGRTGAAINYAVENMDEIVKAYRDRYAAQYRAMGYRPTMVKALTHDSMIREEVACDLLGDVLDSQNVLNKIAGVRPDLLTQVSHAIQRMKQTNAGMVYAANTADFRAATDKIDDIAKKINGALTRATRVSGRGGEGGQRFALPVKFGSDADTYWLNPEAVDQALAKAQADGNQLDADYFQALKDNNKARVREILEQAAIQNGYDPMIQYRGSQDTFTPSSPYFTWTDHRNTFLSPQLKESAVYGRRKEHPSYRTIQSANLMSKLDEIVAQEDDERLVELMNMVMGEGHRYLSDEQKSTMQKSVAASLRPVADQLHDSYEAAASALDEDTSGYAEDVLNFLEGVQSLEENDGDWSLDEVREAAEYADDGFAELTDYYQDSRGEIPSEAMPFFNALHNIQNWTQLERGIEFFETFADPDTHIFSSDLEQAIPREEAVRDLKEKADSGIYQMYLRLGDNPLEFDAKGDMWNELTYDHLDPYSRPYAGTTDDFATWADTNGYSSLIIKNVIDGPIGALDDYIVFDSNNMKSADLVTFDDKDNIIPPSERFNPSKENWRFALDVPFAGLYNLSERVIADTKQNKLGASSVISMLRGKGVKAEEIKWLGLEDFLRGKKSVTKDELLQYIRDNDLVIEEQTLDGSVRPGKYDFTNAEFVDAETGEVIGRTKAEAEQYLIDKYGEEYVHWNVEYSDDPDIGFFASYPSEEDPAFDEAISLAVPARESDGLSTKGNAPHWYQFKLRGGHDYRELLFKLPNSSFETIGSTTHWREDAPGVLAHARVQDFITPSGEDVLFIDEIQSDWHNLGNTIGYDTPDNAGVKRMHEVAQQLTQLDDNWDRDAQEWGPMPDDFEGEVTDFNDEYIKQRDELYDEFLALWDKAFPDTKSTREALNEELDSMTPILEKLWPHSSDYLTQFREKLRPHGYITPNKYQAGTLEGSISEYLGHILQRHNDQLEQIMETEPTNPYKRYLSPEEMSTFLDWVKRRDKFVYKTSMRNAYIANNGPAPEAPFAKNYTDFVLKNLLREAVINEYDGLAWTTGQMQSDRWSDDFAEGYHVEYDQDIPKFLDKFGKKFGARVGTTQLLSDYGRTIEVPYLPITDEMRESILENGLPKFALDVDLPGQLRDVVDRRMPKEQYVYYGDTTQRMQDVGFPADKVPVLQSQRKVRMAMQDKDIDNDSAHGITDWQLAQIPKYLEDPVMIVDVPSDVLGHKPSVLFVTDMLDGDGFPIVAAINAKESAARKRWSEMDVRPLPEFVHEIATVYGRGPLSSSMPRAVTEGPSDTAETGKTFEQFIQKAMDTDNILYISEEGVKNLLRASNEWQNKKNQPRLTATGNLTPRAVGQERSMPGETALQAEGSADSRNRVSPASAFVKRNEPKPLRDTAERAVYNNWVAFPEGFADIPRDVVLHQSRNISAPDQRFAFDVDIPEFDEYMRQMAAMTQQRNAQRQRPTIPTKAEFDRANAAAPVATSATGTGAASRGFVRNRTYDTAERYAEALEKYGAMPPRPSRENGDMPVPQQMNDATRVSEVAQNAMTSRFVTPQMLKTLNKAVADGKMSYFPITDQASAARAKATMIDKGWERTLADWTAEVQSGRVNKDNVTQGLLMYNAALDAGDPQRAIQILVDLSENVRSGAQAVQAMSMLDKLTPEGKLVGLQRSVQNLEREIRDRLGDRAPDSLTIDPNLLQEYLDATDDAQREKVMDKIYQNIADQIPATWADKFNGWRYMAMLANPRTHIRNIAGNAFFAPVRGAKNVIATGLESVFLPKDSGQRTKAIVAPGFLKNAADKARYQAAINEWPEVEAMVQSGGKFRGGSGGNIWGEIRDRQQVFGMRNPDTTLKKVVNLPGRGVEALRKGNSKALDLEDTWFSKPAYASSLAQYLKANGITAEQYNSPGFDKTAAREYAIKEAQKATYRDFNAFSDMVSSLGFKNPKTNVQKGVNTFVEAVLPFKRTPANILVRGVEYSPIGLMNGLKQAAVDVRNGDKTAAEALDQIASGLTGTGLMALGFLLAKLGVLTGGAPDKDKENAMNKLTGHQNYALELNGKSYTLDWLAPEALPVFVGVELFKEKADGSKSGDDLFKPITRITEPVLEMSMLQSLNDIIDSVGYKNDGKLWTLLASAATSYLTQYVPTLGGQIERTFGEKTQQRSYTDKNSPIPTDIQYALAKAMNKTPGEYAQVEYVDEWGRKHDTGSFIERMLTNFFSPGYYSKINETEVDKMLKDLYEATGDTTVYPATAEKDITVNKETHRLTKEQYTSFSETLGTTRYDMLESLRNDPAFKSLSDADKANVVKGVYEYAKGVAEQKIYPEKDVDTWIKDAGKAKSNFGLNPTEYLMLYKQYGSSMLSGEDKQAKAIEAYKAGVPLDKYLATKSSMKNYDADGNDSYTNAETIRGITSAKLDEKQQQAMLGMQLSDSAMTKYNGARAAGISADAYAMILEETTNEKMPANGVRGAHKAKVNAYLQDLVNQQVITPAQKAYLETLSLG